jgi:integrase
MPRLMMNALSDRKVQSLKSDGKYADGRGLYLLVKGARRSWLFLYTPKGSKRVELGLGSQRTVTLAQARTKLQRCLDALAAGKDPRTTLVASEGIPSFGKAVESYLEAKSGTWRNDKHRAQWAMTLRDYAKPLHPRRVDQIATSDVLDVLKPHWLLRPETAQRLQGRITKVLDAAFTKHGLNLPNPARWQGHLSNLLPARPKLTRGHHAALGVDDMPDFISALRARQTGSTAALALEFTILTAARTGEAIGARWDEIDMTAGVWTVPANRMKAGKLHRVPLSTRALDILKHVAPMADDAGYVFQGRRTSKPLSNMAMFLKGMGYAVTVHGFRSSFRDWAAERTNFPREIAEMSLAHTVGDATERAYQRADLLEKRKAIMNQWAQHCEPRQSNNVIPLGKSA